MKCSWALVSVLWEDAFDGENGWTEIADYKPTKAMVVTVGYLWPNCIKGYLTLVNSYFPDEVEDMQTVGMPVHIPNGMVKQISLLEQPSYDENDLM
jgi:hypothetical protein